MECREARQTNWTTACAAAGMIGAHGVLTEGRHYTQLPIKNKPLAAVGRKSDPGRGHLSGGRGVGPGSSRAGRRVQTPFRRCRRLSERHTPADTETLRLSTLPIIGMRMSSSQFSRVSRRMPSPSAPNTQARGPLNFAP